MPPTSRPRVFIDPSYDEFLGNRLFDLSDQTLNRDGQLLPFVRMKEAIERLGGQVDTADHLGNESTVTAAYFSLGLASRFEKVLSNGNASLVAFVIMEPPVVAPHLYQLLPRLTEVFERVHLHNTEGDGYSLARVDRSKLRRLDWPLPYPGVLDQWNVVDRQNRVIVVNGNHKAWGKQGELYSYRIDAMVELAKLDCVELYGKGWDAWWDRRSLWPAYFLNRPVLMRIYKGACRSKYDALSRYAFCMCIENMEMKGYISEKIFDCFYAGTIPLYFGATDVSRYIPSDCFVDRRDYSSWSDMWKFVASMSSTTRARFRDSARDFLASDAALAFHRSIDRIVRPELQTTP